jgi:hypothetical protein
LRSFESRLRPDRPSSPFLGTIVNRRWPTSTNDAIRFVE